MGVSGSAASTVSPSGRLKLASSAPTKARSSASVGGSEGSRGTTKAQPTSDRSEEHTSELQSLTNLVCRLLLEKKKTVSPRRASASSGDLAAETRHCHP